MPESRDGGSGRRLFVLSDPHLSFAHPKPMDIFGPRWENHAERLAANWRRLVGPDDLVAMPGDISWGMRLEDARPDLEWIAALPGQKALIRGNHDYWWSSPAKFAAVGLPGLHFIQNGCLRLGRLAITGTRLWDFPFVKWPEVRDGGGQDRAGFRKPVREADPEKIRARELLRLETCLSSLPADAGIRVVLTHYPPLGEDGLPTPITDRIGGRNVDYCLFGHIHGADGSARPGADCLIGKTRYLLASSDYLEHSPLFIASF